MRTRRIHVNGHRIRANKKGANYPVIVVKDGRGSLYGDRVQIICPCCGQRVADVVQDFESPMSNGAVVWVEVKDAALNVANPRLYGEGEYEG